VETLFSPHSHAVLSLLPETAGRLPRQNLLEFSQSYFGFLLLAMVWLVWLASFRASILWWRAWPGFGYPWSGTCERRWENCRHLAHVIAHIFAMALLIADTWIPIIAHILFAVYWAPTIPRLIGGSVLFGTGGRYLITNWNSFQFLTGGLDIISEVYLLGAVWFLVSFVVTGFINNWLVSPTTANNKSELVSSFHKLQWRFAGQPDRKKEFESANRYVVVLRSRLQDSAFARRSD